MSATPPPSLLGGCLGLAVVPLGVSLLFVVWLVGLAVFG